jgi:electron transfer flavoprotein alpha subunit
VFDDLDAYSPSAWATALLDLAEMLGSDALVAAGSDRGQEIMAHVGARTGLPMAANCLAASWIDSRSVQLSRQRWGGSLVEDAILEGVPALLTVASDGVLAEVSPSPTPTIIRTHRSAPSDLDRRVVVSQWINRGGGVSLADARVVVGGGRGVGSEEGFGALDELAALLGAAVGVSRAVTSAGWRPHAQQVGQTGTKISPELYLACGISGATQHLAGCRSAKHVVTINTDADAPFLSRADYALVGDLGVIIPALSEAIRSRRKT